MSAHDSNQLPPHVFLPVSGPGAVPAGPRNGPSAMSSPSAVAVAGNGTDTLSAVFFGADAHRAAPAAEAASGTEKPSIFCPVCGRHVRSPPALVWHMRIHEGSRPHQCTICPDYAGPTRHALHQHIYKHHRERKPNAPHESHAMRGAAGVMSSPTAREGHLASRELVEPGGAAAGLGVQVFTNSAHASRTVASQAGPRAKRSRSSSQARTSRPKGKNAAGATCPICMRNVRSPPVLAWHMRIHSGARPYVCDLCDEYAGPTRHALSQHVYKFHRKPKAEEEFGPESAPLFSGADAIVPAPVAVSRGHTRGETQQPLIKPPMPEDEPPPSERSSWYRAPPAVQPPYL